MKKKKAKTFSCEMPARFDGKDLCAVVLKSDEYRDIGMGKGDVVIGFGDGRATLDTVSIVHDENDYVLVGWLRFEEGGLVLSNALGRKILSEADRILGSVIGFFEKGEGRLKELEY